MSIVTKSIVTRSLSFAAIGLGLTLASSASAANLSVLPQNAALFSGQRLVDANCYNHLEMQSDGNLVVYEGIGTAGSQALWSTGTWGKEGAADGYASLGVYGELGVYLYPQLSDVPQIEWSSGVASYWPVTLNMQTDGNLVIYAATSAGTEAIWASNTPQNKPSPLVPASCPMESSYTQLYQNVYLDAQSPSVGTESLSGWGQCGTECVAAGSCTAWTSSGNTCTLYTGLATPITNGPIVNPDLEVMSGIIVKPRLEILHP